MLIENNTKSKVGNTTKTSGKKNTLVFQFKHWVSTHRLNSRQKLLHNPINVTTVITFLPLVLGFSQFLIDKSRFSKNVGNPDSFFEKNLPVFTEFKPKVNFETFDYIAKPNSRSFFQKSPITWMFGKSDFVAILKKPGYFDATKFNGLSCQFYLLPSGNFNDTTCSINKLDRNLDDLPTYLKGLHQSTQQVDKSNKIKFLFATKKNFKRNDSLKPDELESQISKKKISLSGNLKYQLKLPLINGSKQLSSELSLMDTPTDNASHLGGVDSISSKFYKERLEFYKNKTNFNKELETLFTEKNISFSRNFFENTGKNQNEFRSLKELLTENTQLSDEFVIESILECLQKKRISEPLLRVRPMSGYNYPDMTSEALYWFGLRNPGKLKTISGIKLETAPLPSQSRHYSFNLKKFPNIPITITQVSLENSKSNKICYKGSALLLDSERALDWKPRADEQQNLRRWFHTYISPLNPLKQSMDNFFGIYYSPKFLLTGQNPDFQDFRKKSLFYETWMNNGPSSGPIQTTASSLFGFSPYSSSFHISYDENTRANQFLRSLDIDFSKTTDTSEFISIPILQIRQPYLNQSGSTSQTEQLETYSTYFSFTSKGSPDYSFYQESVSKNHFVTKKVSGRYFKRSSLFSKTKIFTPVNLDNWEPLTSRSWLIVTQLSFAIFIFQVLKSLAENYGRELLGYLLDLVASLGILDDSLKQEIEILMGQRDKGFRVVFESRKNFKDIVGIQNLLPEIYEVVWFLRNSARDFALSKTLPRGILLTGPPGTGKTLLVQALAGEAQVPVIVLSGSSLIEPGESGALKLEMVFQEARQLAPCMVFIDEIDTLAQKRSGIVQNPMGPDELVESLTSYQKPSARSGFLKKQIGVENGERSPENEHSLQNSSQQDQLSLLTQFLIELDGIQGRDGVIVIGATNRPEVLDPALLRPGRFDKVIQVGLPGHQKRVEILQFYGQCLGHKNDIPWNYLGDRTAGFTAADLSTLMNESTIKAILNKTNHTIETIEHGIDRLTTSESEKHTVLKTKSMGADISLVTIASKMSILRLAYYQAGKIVLSSLLENHPKSVVASLWPRRPTIRSAQIAKNLQNSVFEFARLSEITDRLVGCYAGKAAEILFVQQFSSSKYAQLSTLGLEDLLFAQQLVTYIIDNWFFYSKKTSLQEKTHLSPNINFREFRDISEKLDLYQGIVEKIQNPPMQQALETQTSSVGSKKNAAITGSNSQLYYSIPWWQQQISSELEFVEKNFTNWSRFYLSNPEQNERNPEWLPPDEFYHSSSGLKNVKKAFANISRTKIKSKVSSQLYSSNIKQRYLPEKANFSWNEVALLTRDYPSHSLVLQSFNKALLILNQNRELLDKLVVELLYHEILRQPEIESLLKDFQDQNFQVQEENSFNTLQNIEKIQILESSWGSKSRKAIPRWINFAHLSKETT